MVLAQSLNFRNAAASLGISQPTLTNQINALETALGMTLLERSRTGTILSPQGRELLRSARQVVDAMQVFAQSADTLLNGPATTFRLGVPPTLGPYLLPFVLPELHQKYEQLKLYVREEPPRQLEERLLQGEFDLILSPLPMASSELSVDPLFVEPLKFVVPSDHVLASKERIQPQDISGQNVLTLEEHHHFHRQVQQICDQLNANVQRDFEGTSLDTLRQMVVMGLGVAFLPGLYVHSELHRPEEVHVFELEGMPVVRQHALVWRNTSANRVFFRELASEFRHIIQQKLSTVVLQAAEI